MSLMFCRSRLIRGNFRSILLPKDIVYGLRYDARMIACLKEMSSLMLGLV